MKKKSYTNNTHAVIPPESVCGGGGGGGEGKRYPGRPWGGARSRAKGVDRRLLQ